MKLLPTLDKNQIMKDARFLEKHTYIRYFDFCIRKKSGRDAPFGVNVRFVRSDKFKNRTRDKTFSTSCLFHLLFANLELLDILITIYTMIIPEKKFINFKKKWRVFSPGL